MDNAAEPRPEPSGYRFTLASLMLIMLIISLAAVLLIPSRITARERSNRVSCAGNLCQLYKAMHVYVSAFGKNKDYMPHTGDAFFTCLQGHAGPEHPALYSAKAPMFGNQSCHVCPSSGSDDTSVTPGGAMADYLGPARHPAVPVGNPSALANGVFSGYPIVCDKPGNHADGGCVLRFDGSVIFKEAPDYPAAVKACSN